MRRGVGMLPGADLEITPLRWDSANGSDSRLSCYERGGLK